MAWTARPTSSSISIAFLDPLWAAHVKSVSMGDELTAIGTVPNVGPHAPVLLDGVAGGH